MYRQLADVFLAGDQAEDAATALMEGMIVTQDMEIRRELVSLYQGGYRLQRLRWLCRDQTGRPSILPAHWSTITCVPSRPISIKVRLATGRPDIAQQLKRSFLHDYGCPAAPIEEVLSEKPGS